MNYSSYVSESSENHKGLWRSTDPERRLVLLAVLDGHLGFGDIYEN
jgi:hypothetical protein